MLLGGTGLYRPDGLPHFRPRSLVAGLVGVRAPSRANQLQLAPDEIGIPAALWCEPPTRTLLA